MGGSRLDSRSEEAPQLAETWKKEWKPQPGTFWKGQSESPWGREGTQRLSPGTHKRGSKRSPGMQAVGQVRRVQVGEQSAPCVGQSPPSALAPIPAPPPLAVWTCMTQFPPLSSTPL